MTRKVHVTGLDQLFGAQGYASSVCVNDPTATRSSCAPTADRGARAVPLACRDVAF